MLTSTQKTVLQVFMRTGCAYRQDLKTGPHTTTRPSSP